MNWIKRHRGWLFWKILKKHIGSMQKMYTDIFSDYAMTGIWRKN